MRPPHPDPDQAPLTACTGRVSHDRTIESQLRIGLIPLHGFPGWFMVNATNGLPMGLPCETRPQPAFSQLDLIRRRRRHAVTRMRKRRRVNTDE